MVYGSIYTQVCYSDWLMAHNPLYLFSAILFAPSRCYPSPCFLTLLSYPLTLHYSLHPFHTPYSYTQSSTSLSAFFYILVTPLLQMPHKYRHLCTAVKSKKRGLLSVAFFLCLRTCMVGLVILRMGSLRPASLPGPIILCSSKVFIYRRVS